MLKHHSIFCVDDDAEDRLLFGEALRIALPLDTYQIEFACNGLEAIEKLSGLPLPTITFLDLNMPQKDGLSCLKEIRAQEKYNDMRVVILSTGQREEDITAAYRLGADHYAVKPMSITDLARIISSCLQKLFSQTGKRRIAEVYSIAGFIIK